MRGGDERSPQGSVGGLMRSEVMRRRVEEERERQQEGEKTN